MSGSKLGSNKRRAKALGLSFEEYSAKLEAGEKWCSGCKAWHPIVHFKSDRSRTDGYATICSAARREQYQAKYIPSPRISKLGEFFVPTRDGDKKQARARVNHHIATGLLPDPNTLPCADCTHRWSQGERRHEYDHHKGYSAEHQLDVEAVCTTCHHARSDARGESTKSRFLQGGDRG